MSAATEPVTPATLSRWAFTANEAHEAAGDAEMRLLESRADLVALADVTRAREAAWKVYRALLDAGAAPVDNMGVPTSSADPLRALANADTPDARELLALLRQAVAVAERVDAQRGRALPPSFPLAEGETAGCDLAETLGNVAIRLETEIFGPADVRQAGSNGLARE